MTGGRLDKVVGGISCTQVLARLSDYLDDDVDPATRGQIEEHLRGCDECARFGGDFKATVRALRTHLASPAGLPSSVRARLRAAIKREP